ncbi:hypothetical protein U9M48_040183 [Paspalum notatum var. saurae]|uniref:Uncharacterized protein n=1 Tax=Paspalum notatum var. saurae TaxID=547442 RepID=A0AAQ3UQH1_PASNO
MAYLVGIELKGEGARMEEDTGGLPQEAGSGVSAPKAMSTLGNGSSAGEEPQMEEEEEEEEEEEDVVAYLVGVEVKGGGARIEEENGGKKRTHRGERARLRGGEEADVSRRRDGE